MGSHLAVARVRRKESLATRAKRIGVSVPTLSRMENDDPTVSLGAYAQALWLIGCDGELARLESAPQSPGQGARNHPEDVMPPLPKRKTVSVPERLFAWYLADPQSPVLIGEIGRMGHGDASLTQAPSWREAGFALSEDMPLRGQTGGARR